MKNYEEFTLNGDAFADLRNDFDGMLQKLLLMMDTNHSEDGAISIKVGITNVPTCVELGDDEAQEVSKPVITYKIEYTVPVKESKQGARDTGMQLVFDKETRQFVLKYMQNAQRSLYDDDLQEQASTDTAQSNGPMMLESPDYDGSYIYDDPEN